MAIATVSNGDRWNTTKANEVINQINTNDTDITTNASDITELWSIGLKHFTDFGTAGIWTGSGTGIISYVKHRLRIAVDAGEVYKLAIDGAVGNGATTIDFDKPLAFDTALFYDNNALDADYSVWGIGLNDETFTNKSFGFYTNSTGELYATCGNGSSNTATQITGITLVNVRNLYRAVLDPGVNVKFYVNGTLEATISTNVPSGTQAVGTSNNLFMIRADSSSDNRVLEAEFVSIKGV